MTAALTLPRVDLRSDTVTRPTPGMREAMAQALVGEVKAQGAALQTHLKEAGIDVTGLYRLRLVTHLDVDRTGVDRAISAVRHFFNA
jgi:threonine aldolase